MRSTPTTRRAFRRLSRSVDGGAPDRRWTHWWRVRAPSQKLCPLQSPSRLDALQLALWDAAMTGGVRALMPVSGLHLERRADPRCTERGSLRGVYISDAEVGQRTIGIQMGAAGCVDSPCACARAQLSRTAQHRLEVVVGVRNIVMLISDSSMDGTKAASAEGTTDEPQATARSKDRGAGDS